LCQNAEDAEQIVQFKRCGGKIAFANDELTLIAGEPMNKTTTITLPVSGKPSVPNALKKPASIQRQFDAEPAAKTFVTLTSDGKKQSRR